MIDFCFVAADTSRSRIYLNALVSAGIKPALVVILPASTERLAGMFDTDTAAEDEFIFDSEWPEAFVDLRIGLASFLEFLGVNYLFLPSNNINDRRLVKYFQDSSISLFVYSGYGGSILKNPILSLGKYFLHVHGGLLPSYRGSTTNFYSMLKEGFIAASSIFLSKNIDQGPIIHREVFPVPVRPEKLDHYYDSAARARVLVESLRVLSEANQDLERWTPQKKDEGRTYYVIHPVLKHIAIMRDYGKS